MATLVSNDEAVPGVFLMWLHGPGVAASARPGQFVMVRCGRDTLLRRPLSVHQVHDDRFALLYAVLGRGTEWLSQLGPGHEVDVLGPLGNGFRINQDAGELLLVAGGMGIAPVCFLADEAVRQGRMVRLLYGTAGSDRCFTPPGAEEIPATEDGSLGHCGMVTDLIPHHAAWADQVFACGPPAMYRDMVRRRQELGLAGKPVQVSLEMRMGCGLGVCYSCTVKTTSGLKQVCADGPVFHMDEVIWKALGRIN